MTARAFSPPGSRDWTLELGRSRRFAIGLEYQGGSFHGWQRQPGLPSIQEAVEKALSQVAGEAITTSVAGRTDAGVHALGQVAHFDTPKHRSQQSWERGANRYLPPSIGVTWVREVQPEFHARYSATAREYRYCIARVDRRSGCWAQHLWYVRHALSFRAMQKAAQYLLGRQDFSSFRGRDCQARSPIRVLRRAEIVERPFGLKFRFEADGFLQHMVRNLVGALVRVGTGKVPPEWLKSVLEARDPRASVFTAPACGLYLYRIEYAAQWGIPNPTSAGLLGF